MTTFTEHIQHAQIKHTTTKTIKQQKFNLPQNIHDLIHDKNKAIKLWQKTRQSQYKTQLNKQTTHDNALIKKHFNDELTKKLLSLNLQQNSMWKFTR